MLASVVILTTAVLVGSVVIEPFGNETIPPSSNDKLVVTCSYENAKTCGPSCFPVDVWVDGSNHKPTDGFFVFEVEEEPVTVLNEQNGELDCELILTPECELLEREPPIPPADLLAGCPNCTRQGVLEEIFVVQESDPTHLCVGNFVGAKTVLTTADCVFNKSGLMTTSPRRTVTQVIIHPEYDEEAKENNLALLKVDTGVTSVGFPCICQKSSQSGNFMAVFSAIFSPGPCTLCSTFMKTDVCRQLVSSPFTLEARDLGLGLFATNDDGEEELCGILSSAAITDGGNLNTSSGFTITELPSFYNWINENIDDCS